MIQDKEKQISCLQEDVEVSQRAEATLADLTQQQKEAQDDHIQKLIHKHAVAREHHCKVKANATQARFDAATAAEQVEEAKQAKDEATHQLAQDLVTMLKQVGNLMEMQQEAKRVRCDAPQKSEFTFNGTYIHPVDYTGQDVEGVTYARDVKQNIRDRISESDFVGLNSVTRHTKLC